MKKLLFMLTLACAVLCTGCEIDENATLKTISRPYAGEYKCRVLRLGDEEILPRFRSLTLDVGFFGDFTLSSVDTTGAERELGGTYEVREQGLLILRMKGGGREGECVLSYADGRASLSYELGGRLLYAEFSMTE